MTKDEYLRKFSCRLDRIEDLVYAAQDELRAYEEGGCTFSELQETLGCIAMDLANYGAGLDRLGLAEVEVEQ